MATVQARMKKLTIRQLMGIYKLQLPSDYAVLGAYNQVQHIWIDQERRHISWDSEVGLHFIARFFKCYEQ